MCELYRSLDIMNGLERRLGETSVRVGKNAIYIYLHIYNICNMYISIYFSGFVGSESFMKKNLKCVFLYSSEIFLTNI